jgi:hypothetical protein
MWDDEQNIIRQIRKEIKLKYSGNSHIYYIEVKL